MIKMQEYYKDILEKYKNKESESFPFLTVYLDLRKTADNYEKARIFVKDIFKKIKNEDFNLDKEYQKDKKEIAKALLKYEEELLAWLENNFRSSKNGVVFILGGYEDLFEAIELPLATPFVYFIESKPNLAILAHNIEQLEPSLILLVDSREARTFVSFLGDIEEVFDVKDEHWPLIESKLRMDTEDKDILHGVYSRYVNDIIEKLKAYLAKVDFGKVLIYAPEKLAALFREKLADDKKFFIFAKNLTKSSDRVIKDTILADLQEIENKQDEQELKEALSMLGDSENKKAVSGIKEVLEHLNAGAVQKLFIDESFAFPPVFKNPETGLLGLDNIESAEQIVDLVNELVIAAIKQKASVNFVKEGALDDYGVLAVVRFKV